MEPTLCGLGSMEAWVTPGLRPQLAQVVFASGEDVRDDSDQVLAQKLGDPLDYQSARSTTQGISNPCVVAVQEFANINQTEVKTMKITALDMDRRPESYLDARRDGLSRVTFDVDDAITNQFLIAVAAAIDSPALVEIVARLKILPGDTAATEDDVIAFDAAIAVAQPLPIATI